MCDAAPAQVLMLGWATGVLASEMSTGPRYRRTSSSSRRRSRGSESGRPALSSRSSLISTAPQPPLPCNRRSRFPRHWGMAAAPIRRIAETPEPSRVAAPRRTLSRHPSARARTDTAEHRMPLGGARSSTSPGYRAHRHLQGAGSGWSDIEQYPRGCANDLMCS